VQTRLGATCGCQCTTSWVIISENGDQFKRNMRRLKEAMESVEFDVPMLTDRKWSPRSFGALKPYKDT